MPPYRSVSRRTVLKRAAGIAGAAVAVTGSARGENGDRGENGVPLDFQFVDVIDLGDHVDPGDRIDGALERLARDNRLIEIPDGTYRMGSLDLSGLQHFGIRGRPGGDVVIEQVDPDHTWLGFDDGRHILAEGFGVDTTGVDSTGNVNLQMPGPWLCQDVHFAGRITAGAFRTAVTNPAAVGELRRCSAADGGVPGERSRFGFVPTEHVGEVSITDCRGEWHTDNGIYASPPGGNGEGPVHVVGGLYRNNNIDNVRIGSNGSSIREVVSIQSEAARTSNGRKQRGLWVREPGQDLVVSDNHITMVDEANAAGILAGSAADGATGEMKDNLIYQESGTGPAFNINDPSGWDGSGNHVTGGSWYNAPDEWVECYNDGGCAQPATQPRDPLPLVEYDVPGDDDERRVRRP